MGVVSDEAAHLRDNGDEILDKRIDNNQIISSNLV